MTEGSGNVFLDLGFPPVEAALLLAKADLALALKREIDSRGLTQRAAARLLGTDQPTLSKVLSGRNASVTMDLLTKWLHALGQDVTVAVQPARKSRAA
ncbi:MAG: helix-turn-helix domain-containing protein [Alphaproteobacteria bacterium]|nr:helix-turn-helix domain-containing protein [Alphaproteobacteria bacterium]